MNKRKILIIFFLLGLLIIGGFLFYYFFSYKFTNNISDQKTVKLQKLKLQVNKTILEKINISLLTCIACNDTTYNTLKYILNDAKYNYTIKALLIKYNSYDNFIQLINHLNLSNLNSDTKLKLKKMCISFLVYSIDYNHGYFVLTPDKYLDSYLLVHFNNNNINYTNQKLRIIIGLLKNANLSNKTRVEIAVKKCLKLLENTTAQ
ncbi:MAG: hypothetical protein ABGW69_03860 [Nanoarchaeota archaeon]